MISDRLWASDARQEQNFDECKQGADTPLVDDEERSVPVIGENLIGWDRSLVCRDHNSPMDQRGSEWESVGSRVENAEVCAILGRGMLTWWRQESLEAGCSSLCLATVMRIVKMHEGPSECDDMIQDLEEVLNVGELEDGQPSMLEVSKFVFNDDAEADEHIGCSQTSQTDEALLVDGGPR